MKQNNSSRTNYIRPNYLSVVPEDKFHKRYRNSCRHRQSIRSFNERKDAGWYPWASWRNERLKNRNPKFRNEKWIHISIHDFDVWHSFRLNPEG